MCAAGMPNCMPLLLRYGFRYTMLNLNILYNSTLFFYDLVSCPMVAHVRSVFHVQEWRKVWPSRWTMFLVWESTLPRRFDLPLVCLSCSGEVGWDWKENEPGSDLVNKAEDGSGIRLRNWLSRWWKCQAMDSAARIGPRNTEIRGIGPRVHSPASIRIAFSAYHTHVHRATFRSLILEKYVLDRNHDQPCSPKNKLYLHSNVEP
jgi:hypothetical protein